MASCPLKCVQTKRDGNTKVNLLVGDRRWKFVLGGAAGTPTRVRDDLMLRFVLPKGKTEATCSELLSEAFEQCREQEIAPAWICCDEVLKLSPIKQVMLTHI